jgi:mannose-1-phosphate guanylyltransferase
MPERYVLVLAGGRGERFWPWSRPERPKQLLPLARGGRTLLGATIDRALRLVPREHIVVMTAADLVPQVQLECPGMQVIGEPVGRSTAPAIAVAAALVPRGGVFAVFHADALIDDVEAFTADIARGFEIAEREAVIVIVGIRPTRPDPGFGYIHRGARIEDRLHRVASFKEKPDRATAEAWTASGEYLWNAGMFVWQRSVFMDALAVGRPKLASTFRDLTAADLVRTLADVFPGVEAISVDHAVLEYATNAIVVEAAFDWDDLGSWAAWARRQPRDARGNVLFGDAVAVDCDRCVVVGEGGTAAALGLEDAVVVHVNGATLSCPLHASDDVRRVTEAVRAGRKS